MRDFRENLHGITIVAYRAEVWISLFAWIVGDFWILHGKNLSPITIIAYQTRVFFLLGP